jgi:hypothetical protein
VDRIRLAWRLRLVAYGDHADRPGAPTVTPWEHPFTRGRTTGATTILAVAPMTFVMLLVLS